MTLRLFGNALAGYCVITLIYVGLGTAIDGTYFGFFFDAALAPLAHLYFDVFDGFIQLAVFAMLTMINVSAEYISPEDVLEAKESKRQAKALRLEAREAKRLAKASKNV